MLLCKDMYLISVRLAYILNNPDIPFGGMNMIFHPSFTYTTTIGHRVFSIWPALLFPLSKHMYSKLCGRWALSSPQKLHLSSSGRSYKTSPFSSASLWPLLWSPWSPPPYSREQQLWCHLLPSQWTWPGWLPYRLQEPLCGSGIPWFCQPLLPARCWLCCLS